MTVPTATALFGFSEDAVEGAAGDAEGFGGFALVALELIEDPAGVAPFHFSEGQHFLF